MPVPRWFVESYGACCGCGYKFGVGLARILVDAPRVFPAQCINCCMLLMLFFSCCLLLCLRPGGNLPACVHVPVTRLRQARNCLLLGQSVKSLFFAMCSGQLGVTKMNISKSRSRRRKYKTDHRGATVWQYRGWRERGSESSNRCPYSRQPKSPPVLRTPEADGQSTHR